MRTLRLFFYSYQDFSLIKITNGKSHLNDHSVSNEQIRAWNKCVGILQCDQSILTRLVRE